MKLLPLNEANLELYRGWRNDPEIMKWCRQRLPISQRMQIEWFDRQHNDPTIEMFEISDSLPIGVCGLTSIDDRNNNAEFSLYIRRDSQLEGHGRTALVKLLNIGFRTIGLQRIWGESFAGNPAMKMFLDIGMKQEGIRKEFYYKNGDFIDVHLFSVGFEEWAKRCT